MLVGLSLGCIETHAATPNAAETKAQAVAIVASGDGMTAPLDGKAGDAARGRTLVIARDGANCILCHAVNDPGIRFSGNVGPALDGVGRRFSVPQLRLRVADSMRLNPDTIMPAYYRIDGLDRVAQQYHGKPILTAQQVEDIVAWLSTLR